MKRLCLLSAVLLTLALIACQRSPAPGLVERLPTHEPTQTQTLVPAASDPPTMTHVPPTMTHVPPTATLPPPTPTIEPTATTQPTVTPMAARADQRFIARIVGEGETIGDLARYGMPAEQIMSYNHLMSDSLRPGMPLLMLVDDPGVASAAVLIERGNPYQPRVAITFDAGASSAPTPQILDALRDRGVQVTFFLTGKWIRENPDLTRRIADDGHEIANHSLNHPDFRALDSATILNELDSSERIAQETAGVSTRPFFRPPYGGINRRVIDTVIAAGYLPIYWSLDSLDSVGDPKSADFLFERVATRLTGDAAHGAIVLMHCGSQPTADALPRILDHFAARGVKVTTISEVLGP